MLGAHHLQHLLPPGEAGQPGRLARAQGGGVTCRPGRPLGLQAGAELPLPPLHVEVQHGALLGLPDAAAAPHQGGERQPRVRRGGGAQVAVAQRHRLAARDLEIERTTCR